MEPVDAVVREAVLHSFATGAPNAAPFPPASWEAEVDAVPQQLPLNAQITLADAMFAAYDAGLDPSLVASAASAAGAAYAAARVRNRVAAAALHNDDAWPGGPEVLLPLADDVLVHFVNRLHSDRWVVRARELGTAHSPLLFALFVSARDHSLPPVLAVGASHLAFIPGLRLDPFLFPFLRLTSHSYFRRLELSSIQ